MSERSAYSRVYWSIVDDPKFVTIYDSDPHLAAWLRLLLIADQAHPASAHLPTNVRKSSITALAEAGLIDLTGSRYRIHGLDAERTRRREAATRERTGRHASASQTGTSWGPNGTQTVRAHRAEGLDEDETRRDEGTARAEDPYQDDEGEALTWLAKHGCDVRPGNGYHRQLVTAVQHHGLNALVGMFDRLAAAGVKDGDTKGYLFGAIDALNQQNRPSLKVVEQQDREAERASSMSKRLAATQVRLHENGAHFEEPSNVCPRCAKEGVKP